MADIEAAKAAFNRFDADGDGLITVDEYKRAMAEMGDPFVTGPVAEALIASKDADADGRLSFEEFHSSLRG
ncbi:EF-hand domain-containing protein [Streptomyces sp. NPDC018045]|uniref:EF-hand domain-containing protein n=1 Tax=Streptomyces sp. NPDC018045 TaxID=3365037 RepID=UPI0037A4D10C